MALSSGLVHPMPKSMGGYWGRCPWWGPSEGGTCRGAGLAGVEVVSGLGGDVLQQRLSEGCGDLVGGDASILAGWEWEEKEEGKK